MTRRATPDQIFAMQCWENDYRQAGISPPDSWDRGTHFHRFDSLNRLRNMLWRVRHTSNRYHRNNDLASSRYYLQQARVAAIPRIP